MPTPFAQPSFSSGEIAPELVGRVDVEKRHVALARCRNWRVRKGGSITNRPGTRFIGKAKFGDKYTGRIKFERDADTNYTIEVGEYYMRFWKNRVPIMQANATAASAMLHLPGSDTLWVLSSTPNVWYLTSLYGGPPPIYGKPAIVKQHSSNPDITLSEVAISAVHAGGWAWGDLEGLGFTTMYVQSLSVDLNSQITTGYSIVVPGQYEVTTPYPESAIRTLQPEVSGDVVYIAHADFPFAKLERFDDFDWRYSEVDFNGQTDPARFYEFNSAYPQGSVPSSPDYTIQYVLTRLGTDGNESQGRTLYVVANDFPSAATPPPLGTLGPVWSIESTSQGDEKNIVINAGDYEWIDAFAYKGNEEWEHPEDPINMASPMQVWFLAKKGTGLDGPGAGGTNLAEDPELFGDTDQIGPVMCYDVTNPSAPVAMTRGIKDGDGIPTGKRGYQNLGEWAYGIPSEIRSGPSFADTAIVPFPTLWILSGDLVNTGPMVKPGLRSFELTIEVDAGYNIYRRYAKISGIDGQAQGGSWFPWGRLATPEAYGGTLLAAPDRSPYVDPVEQLKKIVGTYKDNGQITPDETHEPPSIERQFSKAGKYPGAVAFASQRLALAGSNDDPNRIQLSATGEFLQFKLNQIVKDDDPIDRTLTTANRILRMIEVASGALLVFTNGSEWRIWGQGGTLTPSTINAVQISEYGSLNLKPLRVGSRVLYATKLGKGINSLSFDLAQDNFVSKDISAFSGHMVLNSQFVEWDFAATPDKTIHAVREDGVSVWITFDEDQQMNAWHRHDTPNGRFVGVSTIRNGRLDDVYFLTARTIDGHPVQYFEVLDSRDWTDQRQAVFSDSSLTLQQPSIAASLLEATGMATRITCASWADFSVGQDVVLEGFDDTASSLNGMRARVSAAAGGYVELVEIDTGHDLNLEDDYLGDLVIRKLVTRLWGLDHLEGETVTVVGDGRDLGDFVVANARIDLPFGVADAIVGYSVDGEIDSLDFAGAAGTDTLNSKKKEMTAIHVLFKDSIGVEIGASPDDLVAFRQDIDANPNMPEPLLNGIHSVVPFGGPNTGAFYVRTSRPFPAEILSVTPEYEVSG